MKILIFGKVWPEPNSSAAGKRMLQLISLLQQRGEVHFACASALTGNEFDIKNNRVITHEILLNNDNVNDFLNELQPDVVVFDRFITEEQYAWRVIEQCPQAIRILNTEDLHFLRKLRQQFVKEHNEIPTSFEQLDFQNEATMRELACIYRSDWTLLISPIELDLLVQEMSVPGELLGYLPIFSSGQINQPNYDETNTFLFIGNALHEPNLDAIRQIRDFIWPNIRKQLPQSKLKLAVAYPTQEVKEMHQPKLGIEVVQHHHSLDEIYANVRVSLVPLRFGAGIKGKILEAMERGVPFVTTTIGREGLILENWKEYTSNNWEDFSKKAVELYTNKQTWMNQQEKEKEHLASFFLEKQHALIFLKQFDDLIKTIHSQRKKRYYSQLLQHHSLMSTRYLSKWIMEKEKNRCISKMNWDI